MAQPRRSKRKIRNIRRADPSPMRPRAATRKSRSPRLPGLEDSVIQPLEHAALAYADIRDQRMELSKQEVSLKGELLTLLKKHGKTHYQRDGITVDLVTEEETVRVRVHKPGKEEAEAEESDEIAVAVDGGRVSLES